MPNPGPQVLPLANNIQVLEPCTAIPKTFVPVQAVKHSVPLPPESNIFQTQSSITEAGQSIMDIKVMDSTASSGALPPVVTLPPGDPNLNPDLNVAPVTTDTTSETSITKPVFETHLLKIHSARKLDQDMIQNIVKTVLADKEQKGDCEGQCKVKKPYHHQIRYMDEGKKEKSRSKLSFMSYLISERLEELAKTSTPKQIKTKPINLNSDQKLSAWTPGALHSNTKPETASCNTKTSAPKQIKTGPIKLNSDKKFSTRTPWEIHSYAKPKKSLRSKQISLDLDDSDDLLETYVRTPLEKFVEDMPLATPPSVEESHAAGTGRKMCAVFRCDLCLAYFPSASLMLAHKITHIEYFPQPKFKHLETSGKMFEKPCRFCDRVFLLAEILAKHERLVHGEEPDGSYKSNPYKCGICGTKCTSVKKHISNIHKDVTHRCPLCNRGYKNLYLLNKHALRENLKCHAVHARHACPQCGKRFLYKDHCVSHFKKHFGSVPPFCCTKCFVIVDKVMQLYDHLFECKGQVAMTEQSNTL
jgi:DNA-directed RNA polymerase subunit RPC12/RpoP